MPSTSCARYRSKNSATAPAGQHYREPHLFIFHVGPDLLIDSITAYWNDAGISQQLGHTEVH